MTLREFLKIYPATNSKTFGAFIKINREEMGLSIRAFAIDLDISPVYLCDIERGARPVPVKLLETFKHKFDVQPDEEEAFYDMAHLSRDTVAPEIILYLIANPEARQAIRKTMKKNLSGKDLLSLVESHEDNLSV